MPEPSRNEDTGKPLTVEDFGSVVRRVEGVGYDKIVDALGFLTSHERAGQNSLDDPEIEIRIPGAARAPAAQLIKKSHLEGKTWLNKDAPLSELYREFNQEAPSLREYLYDCQLVDVYADEHPNETFIVTALDRQTHDEYLFPEGTGLIRAIQRVGGTEYGREEWPQNEPDVTVAWINGKASPKIIEAALGLVKMQLPVGIELRPAVFLPRMPRRAQTARYVE
jgi:hypothetical protein